MTDEAKDVPPSVEEVERQRREEEALLREKGFVPTRAFVKAPKERKAKSAGARRVAEHRQRQREKGLVSTTAPAAVIEAVAAAGGWVKWQAALQAAAAAERPVDGQRPPPTTGAAPGATVHGQRTPELSAQDRADLDLGRRIRELGGWRARAARWLLG